MRTIRGRRASTIAVLTATLILANACSLDPPVTPTTQAVIKLQPDGDYDSDVVRIVDLFDAGNAAWEQGPAWGVQFVVDHSHPDSGLDSDDFKCMWLSTAEHKLVITVDPATIVRVDGWVLTGLPGSRIEGTTPRGRIYEMSFRQVFSGPGVHYEDKGVLHVAIVDGGAFWFQPDFLC